MQNSVSNPFTRPPATPIKGSLLIYPQSASIEGDVGVKGKLQVFCRLHLGAGLTESVHDKKNDRHPVWTQELSFRRETESDLIINLYTKNLVLAPTYLCECRVNLSGVFMSRQVVVTPELVRKGTTVGSMKVLLKWEPDAQPQYIVPVQPPQMQQYSHPPQMQQYSSPPQMQQYSSPPQMQQFHPPHQQVFPPQMVYSHAYQQVYHQPVMNVAPMMASGHYVARPQMAFGHSAQPQVVSVVRLTASSNQHKQQAPAPKKQPTQIIEEPGDPNLPEDQKCVICLDRKKAGAFYKCGHSCTCVTCGTEFIGKPCPICREHVLDFIKVFDS